MASAEPAPAEAPQPEAPAKEEPALPTPVPATEAAAGAADAAPAEAESSASAAAPSRQAASAQMAALYVGDLHPEVTEVLLYETFSAAGNVASCRVCRDNVTRRSLGYAYVNYFNLDDARQALDTLNYTQMKGRSIRIMWSQRDPTARKNTASNLIVKHLDESIDNKGLYDLFKPCGTILSCKVQTDPTGKSKGFGFVHLETEEAAKKAIDDLNGKTVGSSTLFVGPFMTRQELQQASAENYTNLYVKHMPQDWDEAKVNEVFSEYGELQSAVIQETGDGKRFGLVNFKESSAAKKAVDALHRKDMRPEGERDAAEKSADAEAEKPAEATGEDGKADAAKGDGEETKDAAKADDFPEYLLYVQRAQTREERSAALREKAPKKEAGKGKGKTGGTAGERGVKVMVRNLAEGMSAEKLKELFEPHGTILSTVLKPVEGSEEDPAPNVGYITLSTAAEAAKAVEEMNDKEVEEKKLSVSIVEPRKRGKADRDGGEKQDKKGKDGKGKGKGKGAGKAAPPMAQFRPGMPQPCAMPMMGMGKGGYVPPAQGMPQMAPGGMPMAYSLPPAFASGKGVPAGMPGGMRPPAAAYNPAQFKAMQMQMQAAMVAAMGRGMPAGMPAGAARPGMPQSCPQVSPALAGPPGPPSTEALSALSPAAQKQVLGERLFPLVQRRNANLAGKITGMLLELPNSDLIALLKSDAALQKKVDEAVNVLQKKS